MRKKEETLHDRESIQGNLPPAEVLLESLNSPRLWNKGVSRTYTEVLTAILKYRRTRMGYDEIECNRNKDTGNGLPTLNGQSEPT
ncbi:hypothetical protein L6164_037795 [Bauhinia variegata]|uniref:Uncharacterized protein n=1 Tax=Bauhinia variegata TaxID=167791 RepID=A0ACB9KLB2_BAUVA|nr:hypothetical protein L6164_037795 [Bauhinia variegata]